MPATRNNIPTICIKSISLLKYIFKIDLSKIVNIYKGWLIIFPLVLGFIFAGRVYTIIGIFIISFFAFTEYAKATGLYRDWFLTGFVYLGIILLAIVTIIKDPRLNVNGWYGMYMTMPVYFIALALLIPIIRNKSKGQLQNVSLTIVGYIYFIWMFGHLAFLANSNNPYGYLMFLIFAVSLNDVFAFIFGKMLGRHRLRRGISPNKTWEGSICAFLISMLMPWLLKFSFPYFKAIHLILAGIIIGIGGQIGDLVISFIKRDIGIKDMGLSIPGHGGILDRIDSLIFTAPILFHMIRWFFDIYPK